MNRVFYQQSSYTNNNGIVNTDSQSIQFNNGKGRYKEFHNDVLKKDEHITENDLNKFITRKGIHGFVDPNTFIKAISIFNHLSPHPYLHSNSQLTPHRNITNFPERSDIKLEKKSPKNTLKKLYDKLHKKNQLKKSTKKSTKKTK